MVIGVASDGELRTTNISGNYLVSTNFNLNNKDQLEYELHHSGRYNTTATRLESLLLNSELGVDGCRDILEEIALNPGLGYGYIADLKQGRIYIYSHDDFKRTAVLDTSEEFAKKAHSYALETLVTQQTGVMGPYMRNSLLFSAPIIIIIFILSWWVYISNIKPLLSSETITEFDDGLGLNTVRPWIPSPRTRLRARAPERPCLSWSHLWRTFYSKRL
jgi:hypothetical protein